MEIRAALAGNPNCGKTTMFNALTGANQYVGNWPGVTVEKKEGKVRTKESKEEKIKVTDLPGVYSLSPYTLEEVVSRDYILNEDPDVIINLVDATNIERNLYLTTQLTETGVPVVIALNMADLIRKRGMKIDKKRLSELLNCPVIETSALKKTGLKELIEETVCTVKSGEKSIPKAIFSKELEAAIRAVEELLPTWIDERKKRWYAVKLLENDRKVLENLKMSGESLKAIKKMRKAMEEKHDDDMESIVTDERYQYAVSGFLGNIGAGSLITGLVVDGIIGGLGAVLGFVPQMAVLFLLLSFLEDCGYMVRIAFVMDRVFRHFGLSGKSFIPLLISSGCGIPGIMASRTIEQDNDRRLTIMTATFIPCGAKLPVIALMGGVIAGEAAGYAESSFIAPLMYFIGIAAVLISAIILKKTKMFSGKPAPFVMELPQYHMPQAKTVLLHVWERLKGFMIKAGTILFLACIVMWFLGGFGFSDGKFGIVQDSANSLLAMIGGALAVLFKPLGFGEWQPVAAALSGFTAKEAIVTTMGVLANVSGDVEDTVNVAGKVAAWFPSAMAAFSFLLFNLLDSPCLAAIATMAQQMQSRKWFWFAVVFQNVFAYVVSLSVYQIGTFVLGGAFTVGTAVGIAIAVILLILLFRPDPYKNKKIYSKRSVQAA